MKIPFRSSLALLGILLQLPHISLGWLSLKADVPMGHGLVEFRIRKFPPAASRRTGIGSFRLPKSVSPIHYDLQIRPIIDQEQAYGRQYYAPGNVTIRIKCLNATSSVTLHARWLEINFFKIKIRSLNTGPVRVTGFNMDEEDDRHFLTIFFDRDLTVNGEYLLSIPFTAIIAYPEARQSGIYRSTYDGSDGTRKTLVVTQFQKSYAREAFPCFDEPSFLFKATFSIKIGRKPNYTTFSNMDKIGEPTPIPECPGWVWDTYEKTVKLPIYAIAFAVANDYAAEVSPPQANGVAIKTWVPKAELTNTSAKFSTTASAHILKFYEDLFDFPYPNTKMDNFATPMNLWGMENLGLITYRPLLLLWNADENTQFEKWNSAWMIAHEFVHMWFGNLVTCEWWNDFWLNEGFARYFQFVGAQIAGEDFRATDRFVIDVVQWAMILDEGPDSVPVHGTEMQRVTYAPFQIEYDKAGALIRMMATFLTQETFFSALKVYFKRHQFSNTVQDDLFQAMTDQAVADGTLTQFTVKEVMDTWTKMRGFPVIRVSRADNDTVYISQHRFVYHPSSHNIESGLWYVPIWYITKSNPTFRANNTTPQFWMDKDTIITYFHINNTDEWIIVNPEARGYYRVIYDDHLTNLIITQLEQDHNQLNFATRSQLIDDHFRSAQARYISIRYAMDITWYLPKEDDLIVWTTALNNFRSLYTRLIDTNIITPFRKYLLRIVIPPLKRIGVRDLPKDTPSDIMLRGQLLDWACALEHDLCSEYATELFRKWMANPDGGIPIPTEYQPQLYCAAVAAAGNSSPEMHKFLLKYYKETTSSRQKELVIKALSCDQSSGFLKKLMFKAIDWDETEINVREHGRLLLESLATSSVGRNMTWKFVKENYRKIVQMYNGQWTMTRIISTLAPYTSSKGLSKVNIELTSFISHYIRNNTLEEWVEKSLQNSAHKIVENSYWMEYYFYDLKEWLMLYIKS